jgi:2-methylcitrate dehydratase PrpD
VCYWAQAAIAGALTVQRTHRVPLEDILRIHVATFHEASRLAVHRPETTEEAQYSLPFPVAAALVHGQLGPDELTGSGLRDPRVLELADRVVLVADPDYSRRFPLERLARVRIETNRGETFDSGETKALWDGVPQPTDQELRQKFRWLVRDRLPLARADALEEAAWNAFDLPDAGLLLDLLTPPIEPSSAGAA